MNLTDELQEAKKNSTAIGHFNFSDLAILYGVATAARTQGAPVIVGVSEDERAYTGVAEAAALVKAIAARYNQRIYINADHTHIFEDAIAAAKAGFDSIVYDRSDLPMKENIAETARAVRELKAINPKIYVEGEIGNIGSGSEVHDVAPENLDLSTGQEAIEFVHATGVDGLAPAVGNMHGVLHGMVEGKERKHLNIPRIAEIAQAVNMPMTLHGGSDTDENDLRSAIKAGMTIVHISTEIRLVWRKALDAQLSVYKNEIAPHKLFKPVQDAVAAAVEAKLKIFSKP